MENQEKEVVRPLHELYELLYDNVKDLIRVKGLCLVISDLHDVHNLITITERIQLKDHFISQKPTEYVNKYFYDDAGYFGTTLWWVGENATKNRKLFVKRMIEITKPKN